MIFYSPDSPQEKPSHGEGDGERERCRTVENDDDEDRKFWEEPTPYTPESRLETHRYMEEKRRAKDNVRYFFVLISLMNWRRNFQRCREKADDCLTLNITDN